MGLKVAAAAAAWFGLAAIAAEASQVGAYLQFHAIMFIH